MDFPQLLSLITEQAQSKTETFVRASENIQRAISQLDEESMLNILYNIGSIPESLPHDSTEEKLFAKAADIILAEAFNRLGFQAETYRERANCADVCGISVTEGYSFVADAKTFRMSRTAKNQKDFKVKALSEWRRNSDYAILVVPYFQYPRSQSQVYQQAIDSNVCLLSWEHLTFMLKNHISETSKMRLKAIWNISDTLSTLIVHANLRQRENFIHANRSIFCETIGLSWDSWLQHLEFCRNQIAFRSREEIAFWEGKILEIESYSREKAISELLHALKLRQKIQAIRQFVTQLPKAVEELNDST